MVGSIGALRIFNQYAKRNISSCPRPGLVKRKNEKLRGPNLSVFLDALQEISSVEVVRHIIGAPISVGIEKKNW